MSILTKEVIQKILNDDWLLMDDCEGLENCTVIKELARMALAAMDSEPVAYTEKHEISNMHATGLYLRAWPADRARNAVEGYTIPLYRHAQKPVIPDGYVMVPKEPTPEMLAVINEAIKSMRGSAATYARVLAAAPQEVSHG
ncbi:hypothetical protein [Klebsiella michiganensis]|uniref:hypothetical protein n=1 Tax=Klebsiella michiganensis TaxID=1134687 RepID=UPI00215D6E65|nr:hypothetical protein [Klebsiella michiganensis]